jgi:hypothetical protein
MARQAEAEREKRAKIIAAEGEALSAGRLAEAADVIADHPVALQLRNLQILAEIAAEKNSTIVFPAQLLDSARAVTQFVEAQGNPGSDTPLPTIGPAADTPAVEPPDPDTPPQINPGE